MISTSTSHAHAACFLASGVVTALGTGIAAQLAGLRAAPTAPVLLQRPLGNSVEAIPYKPLAEIAASAPPAERLLHSIELAVQQVLDASGLTAAEQQNMALFVGSSSFDIAVSEHQYQQAQQVRGAAIPLGGSSSFGNLADTIRQRYTLRGPEFSFNTACTSSANALWYASKLIRSGQVRHALVLGVELANDMTAFGFHGLGLLTHSVMKPFDRERDGLVLGEAVSALLLGPGNNDDFRLLGGANLCDTYSMSAANADGSTVAAVIQQALTAAQLTPAEIACIKAHGTASLLNDEAEAAGLLRVFDNPLPPVCVLKPFLGHTLGACGLTELILMWQALTASTPFLPCTPDIGANADELGVMLTQTPQTPPTGACLLNYFGFGGNNSALIIGTGAQGR